ncbi:MAG: glutathione S-transferase family protein [Sphingomonadales bacterium]|nr:MAG: glutathione S-transferase family protein [Sphingomonadales bacterium]
MLKFYHAPWSRSSNVLWLMEELGVPYEIELVDIRAPVPDAYRKIQPNKKVPAIDHDGVIVTERAAISIYLADAFPQAGLAPKIGDKDRGAYLTWLVYADSVFDPAVAVHTLKLEYPPSGVSFGSYDDLVANLERRLTEHEYVAGDRFTAADVQVAGSMGYVMREGWLPEKPAFKAYVERCASRPAAKRADAKDMEMARGVPAFAEMFKGS